MNWLGKLIQKHVNSNDTVLDLGCGIMQATTDSITKSNRKKKLFRKKEPEVLECKTVLGCDIWDKYLNVAKNYFPVAKISMNELDRFMDDSFDVVICLDVLEHLELKEALNSIDQMKRISRKKVIVYTPSKFKTNEEHVENVWNLGENLYQEHKCFIEPSKLEGLGFKISFPEPDKNTLGVWLKNKN